MSDKVIPEENTEEKVVVEDTTKPEEKPEEPEEQAGDNTEQETPAQEDGTTPEQEEEQEEEKPSEFDPEKWGKSDNEVVNDVLQLLHEGGADPTQAKALLFGPIQEGTVENIDRDALIEMVGKSRANLIMTGIKAYVGEQTAAADAAASVVYDAAGGKEAWQEMLPWVNAMPEADRDEFRQMIDNGGAAAKLAVQEIRRRYNADPKTKSIGKSEIKGDTASNKQEKGLSQREYGDQLILLQRTGRATPEALAELRAKRQAGRKQGL